MLNIASALCATGYHHACGLDTCECDCHAPPSAPMQQAERCPRCNGRLFLDGNDVTCLPCGWVKPPAVILELVTGHRAGPRPSHAGARL